RTGAGPCPTPCAGMGRKSRCASSYAPWRRCRRTPRTSGSGRAQETSPSVFEESSEVGGFVHAELDVRRGQYDGDPCVGVDGCGVTAPVVVDRFEDAVDAVEPGRRVVHIGVQGEDDLVRPGPVETRFDVLDEVLGG